MKRKSISAVVIGVLFVIIASTVVDIILHKLGVYPPLNTPMDDSLSLLALSYRIVISIYAGYLTARLAPDRPVQHALYLGYAGTVLGSWASSPPGTSAWDRIGTRSRSPRSRSRSAGWAARSRRRNWRARRDHPRWRRTARRGGPSPSCSSHPASWPRCSRRTRRC